MALNTPIAVRINFDGAVRRVSLPLGDLSMSHLDTTLRTHLKVPGHTPLLMERYSDSVASFVVIDSSNVATYKQLYRAAKAKHKLKLRITTKSGNGWPKPASVEDAPESESTPVPRGPPGSQDAVEDEPVPAEEVLGCEPSTSRWWKAPENHQTVEQVLEPTSERTADPATEPMQAAPATQSSQPVDTIPLPADLSMCSELLCNWQSRMNVRFRLNEGGVLVLDHDQSESAPAKRSDTEATTSQLSLDACLVAPPTSCDNPARLCATNSDGLPSKPRRPFNVCCNSCDEAIDNTFWHCSTCEDGDFDLCDKCHEQEILCFDTSHCLERRLLGPHGITRPNDTSTPMVPTSLREEETAKTEMNSTMERTTASTKPSVENLIEANNSPKTSYDQGFQRSSYDLPYRPAPEQEQMGDEVDRVTPEEAFKSIINQEEKGCYSHYSQSRRTCNVCLAEGTHEMFVECETCPDFDVCEDCFASKDIGHHPKHAFRSAVPDAVLSRQTRERLAPGRNLTHYAICDGCDKYIKGVRHKCLDCPDWDYCSECILEAPRCHSDHRFVPIYERMFTLFKREKPSAHVGIYCDGPLCTSATSQYISGIRYKCAICHDVDFCANCEASPANSHNPTHPLIKFKTPIRAVSVTTTGEHEDGKSMPRMGDHHPAPSAYHETQPRDFPVNEKDIATTPVQTVAEMKPAGSGLVGCADSYPAPVVKEGPSCSLSSPAEPDLVAVYLRDTVADGTVIPPNQPFVQTWVLRNEGTSVWPAGCAVKFVGGDYMGAVDSNRPAGVRELADASQSMPCNKEVRPGDEQSFSVLMRTPAREGKVISYWRLTSKTGIKFGHKLWCDVSVEAPPATKAELEAEEETARSQMIIPKLEHESASSSLQLETRPDSVECQEEETEAKTETDTLAPLSTQGDDEFDDCGDVNNWAEDSDDAFMTDEEYDILDASDEEYLSEQQKKQGIRK